MSAPDMWYTAGMENERVSYELWAKVEETGKEFPVASGFGTHDSANDYVDLYVQDGVRIHVVEVTETRRVVA